MFLCDLFCPWDNQTLREQVWVRKRAKLHAAVFDLVPPRAAVQEGFWFSAHEVQY